MGEYASAGPNLLVPRQIPKNLDVGREFIQSQHVDDHAQRFDEQSSLGSLQHADSVGGPVHISALAIGFRRGRHLGCRGGRAMKSFAASHIVPASSAELDTARPGARPFAAWLIVPVELTMLFGAEAQGEKTVLTEEADRRWAQPVVLGM